MFLDRIVDLFNRYSPILIQTPAADAIGNCAEDIYFGLLRARRLKKKVFFLFPFEFGRVWFSKCRHGINSELKRINSRYRFGSYDSVASKFSCLILTLIYCVFRLIHSLLVRFGLSGLSDNYLIPRLGRSDLWCPGGLRQFTREHVYSLCWERERSIPLDVHLSERSRRSAAANLRAMGVSAEDWFVCLHVRDGGYYGHNEGIMKLTRNSDILKCIPAIRLITERGGWVIRMGDSAMKPLPEMDRVIDYPMTAYKSDLMDLYLISECRFYIGSQSGIWSVAQLFNKPLLTINMNEWMDSYPERPGDLGIFKHIYSKQRNRFLSIQEAIDEFSEHQFGFDYVDRYELHENTPDEIAALVLEFMEQDQGNIQLSEQQKYWNEMRVEKGFDYLEHNRVFPDDYRDSAKKFQWGAHICGCVGSISDRFLQKHWKGNALNHNNG